MARYIKTMAISQTALQPQNGSAWAEPKTGKVDANGWNVTADQAVEKDGMGWEVPKDTVNLGEKKDETGIMDPRAMNQLVKGQPQVASNPINDMRAFLLGLHG